MQASKADRMRTLVSRVVQHRIVRFVNELKLAQRTLDEKQSAYLAEAKNAEAEATDILSNAIGKSLRKTAILVTDSMPYELGDTCGLSVASLGIEGADMIIKNNSGIRLREIIGHERFHVEQERMHNDGHSLFSAFSIRQLFTEKLMHEAPAYLFGAYFSALCLPCRSARNASVLRSLQYTWEAEDDAVQPCQRLAIAEETIRSSSMRSARGIIADAGIRTYTSGKHGAEKHSVIKSAFYMEPVGEQALLLNMMDTIYPLHNVSKCLAALLFNSYGMELNNDQIRSLLTAKPEKTLSELIYRIKHA